MATAVMPSSFVYEDLVSKVQNIQDQIDEIHLVLINRWKNEKRKRDELKSRSFVFLDPYGNQIVRKHMDHELISQIVNKYKKDCIPKYLHQWIKFGTMKRNLLTPLNDCQLKSNVAAFADGSLFVTYGTLTVWIGTDENTLLKKVELRVLLTDTLEKIQIRIKNFQPFSNIELKSYVTNTNALPKEENWKDGTMLKPDDTILSSQLFQDNCVILAKISGEKEAASFSNSFGIQVKSLAGRTTKLSGHLGMSIFTLKELVRDREGIPPDQQCLMFAGQTLEDENTLEDYNIQEKSTIHMVLRLRGGMYHFTSGRQDFDDLPYESVKAIQNVLAFKLKNLDQHQFLSSAELQEFVSQAYTILSSLHNGIQEFGRSETFPDLKDIVLPTATTDDEEY